MKLFLLVFFMIEVSLTWAAFPDTVQYAGENCITVHNNGRGVCRTSFQCPAALELLWRFRIRPTICSYDGLNPIVCCPDNGSPPQTPTPTKPPTQPTRPPTQPTRPPTQATRPTQPPQLNERISQRKCRQYKTCTQTAYTSVVGGEDTKRDEFPHMTAIGWKKIDGGVSWSCGGSLISENFIISAAHCTESFDSSLISSEPSVARLGEWNIKQDNDGARHQDIDIIAITRHPQYLPPSKYHDIALMKLARNAVFGNNVRPMCLWRSSTLQHQYAVATGWGKLGYTEGASDILQKVTLQIVDNTQCQSAYENKRGLKDGIIDKQLCAGDPRGGKDTCQGDSGGPLQVPDRELPCAYHLIGVTSFGIGCGSTNPGVYTRISSYLDWIESIVWPQ